MSDGRRASANGTSADVRQRDLILFCRQLGTMLGAGTDILRALSIVQEQVADSAVRQALEMCRNDMTLGSPLARCMERFPDIFDPFFVGMVRQGEGDGTLSSALQSLADYQEKDLHFSSALPLSMDRAALRRPAVSAFSAVPDQPLRDLAVWLGAGSALAAAVWGVLAALDFRTPALAAAWCIVALAFAGWGWASPLRSARVENEPHYPPEALATSANPQQAADHRGSEQPAPQAQPAQQLSPERRVDSPPADESPRTRRRPRPL